MVSISLFHWLETKVEKSNMEGFPFLHHLTHLQLYQRLIILHVVVKQIKKTFFPIKLMMKPIDKFDVCNL